ncbi:rRNA maturation RNase YbeY [Gammaproteobacteria bacterium SCGC AG-212-F23]|nr:rRNA maturation RNase YbeY [Gammaproteobacteria bacterium SCGC AG-212-F23]
MYRITVQRIDRHVFSPESRLLKQWAKSALIKRVASAELTIRIVDIKEITELNTTYRKKNKPTNVLSFPFDVPPLLGDIVICSEIVNQEAKAAHKEPAAHWAHMVIHGVLHLLGYDHENDIDAEKMEAEEVAILKTLGFKNPYKENTHERS